MKQAAIQQDKTVDPGGTTGAVERSGSHLALLVICGAVPVLGVVLVVNGEGNAALWFAPDHSFPQTCWSRAVFQWDCPFCGLTRSVIYLCHGRLEESLAMHRLGWLVFAAILASIPVHFVYWLKPQTHSAVLHRAEWTVWLGLGGLLVINRIVEMTFG